MALAVAAVLLVVLATVVCHTMQADSGPTECLAWKATASTAAAHNLNKIPLATATAGWITNSHSALLLRCCCCHCCCFFIPDFTYSQVAFAGAVSWPGRTHEGFSKLAAYLWLTGVQEAVDALVLVEGSSIQHVVVTGHSMGAGVSTLLSYSIQVGNRAGAWHQLLSNV